MTARNAVTAPVIGLAVGLVLGYVDSRPTWDDTGITAVAVFSAAAVLVMVRPKLFWLTGVAVGLPILVMNAVLNANYGSALAVVIGLAGAAVGYQVRKLFGFSSASHGGA